MIKKIILMLAVATALPSLADTGLKGRLVEAGTTKPVAEATVMVKDQAIMVTSGPDGSFIISNAAPGPDLLQVFAFGYEDYYQDVKFTYGIVTDLGDIQLQVSSYEGAGINSDEFIFDDEQIAEDEGATQNIGTIQGASNDVFYQMANYNFSMVYYKNRGLDNNWQSNYINGFSFNDLTRGAFSYSSLGGLTSSAFRSKSTVIGTDAASFGYGSIGGSSNMTTYASEYAPGFRGNLSYQNGNYWLRAMLQYSTGLNSHGWALSASVIGRWSNEGVIEGTFYNSFGYALSIQKVFNEHHSLNLSTWGAPTQRATSKATTEEAYRLAGNNLYNPSWGYLNGDKLSDRITETFDPTVTLNWIWKPKLGTTLNTGVAFRHNAYNRTGLNWYRAADPRPDYYKNMPNYFLPTATPGSELYDVQLSQYNYYVDLWENDESIRQINWDQLYQTNLLNRTQYDLNPSMIGSSSYILENKRNNFASWMLNSTLNHRLNEHQSISAGVSLNYTNAHSYKTVRDLLGGEFWRDIDNFSERDFAGDPNRLQNDMNNPNRKVGVGDKFGYDYNMHNVLVSAWAQHEINLAHFNINYGVTGSYRSFQRDGNMRNGRAPENSYGKGNLHEFGNFGAKAGVTYKLDGRNYFTIHGAYGTRAPRPYDSYVSANIKDNSVPYVVRVNADGTYVMGGLRNEKYISADLSYTWNYPNFRGSVTGYYNRVNDAMRGTFFYDYELKSAVKYTVSGLDIESKGIQLGMEWNIWNNLSLAGAGVFSRTQFKNNPYGVRSYENGSAEDVVRRVYLKNYHVGCTPQQAYSVALKYNIDYWFFEVNANWLLDNYVDLAYARHEEMPGLWKECTTPAEYEMRRKAIAYQDKMGDAFFMNLSIGKMIYTKFGSLNFNLNITNILNNRDIKMSGYQEGKFDYTDYNVNKFPNKYTYAQGIKVFFNVGIRF